MFLSPTTIVSPITLLLYLNINLIRLIIFSTVLSSVSNGNFKFDLYILFVMLPQLTIFESITTPLSIVTIVSSTVLSFVLLHVIATTLPETFPISTQSPIANGLSLISASPEITCFTIFCAANATIAPPIPSPAAKLPISKLNSFKLR